MNLYFLHISVIYVVLQEYFKPMHKACLSIFLWTYTRVENKYGNDTHFAGKYWSDSMRIWHVVVWFEFLTSFMRVTFVNLYGMLKHCKQLNPICNTLSNTRLTVLATSPNIFLISSNFSFASGCGELPSSLPMPQWTHCWYYLLYPITGKWNVWLKDCSFWQNKEITNTRHYWAFMLPMVPVTNGFAYLHITNHKWYHGRFDVMTSS